MAGNANSGTKPLNDRKLAGEVRNLTLHKMKRILTRPTVEMNQRELELHDQLLLKLAGTILPKLVEHSGENGAQLNFGVVVLPAKNQTLIENAIINVGEAALKENATTVAAENTLAAAAETGDRAS